MCKNCAENNLDNMFPPSMESIDYILQMMEMINPEKAKEMRRELEKAKKSAMARAIVETTKDYNTYRSGVKRSIRIDDFVTLHILSNRANQNQVNLIANYLRTLSAKMPAPGNVDVYFPAKDIPGDGGMTVRISSDKESVVYEGNDRAVFLSGSLFDGYDLDMRHDFVMPAFWAIGGQQWKYATTHEWGHVIDNRTRTNEKELAEIENRLALTAHADIEGSQFNTSLSLYGRSDEPEAYAEAFAQWFIDKGNTNNFAANWYAKEYNWNMQ